MSDYDGSGGGWGPDGPGQDGQPGWDPPTPPTPTPPTPPPPTPPPAYQPQYPTLPAPDGQRGRYGPAYGGYQPPKKSNTNKVLLIIGIVLLVFVILVGLSCVGCARGCQRVVEEVKKNSYRISHGGETRWIWQGQPQPRDTAPPDAQKDAETRAGAQRIKRAITAYQGEYGEYPSETEVDSGGDNTQSPNPFSRFVTTWPVNPWTNRKMDDSPHRGDFIYVLWNDGTYTLRVFLSSGEQDL